MHSSSFFRVAHLPSPESPSRYAVVKTLNPQTAPLARGVRAVCRDAVATHPGAFRGRATEYQPARLRSSRLQDGTRRGAPMMGMIQRQAWRNSAVLRSPPSLVTTPGSWLVTSAKAWRGVAILTMKLNYHAATTVCTAECPARADTCAYRKNARDFLNGLQECATCVHQSSTVGHS